MALGAAIRMYRLSIDETRRQVVVRARAFHDADSRAQLSERTAHARRILLAAAAQDSADDAAVRQVLGPRLDRVFLRADGRGDGQVVEVLGDLVGAKHVVLIVPGMTNELANYETGLRPKAVNFLAEMRRQAGHNDVAVVAWLGYDTPDGSVGGLYRARGSGLAKRGAASLTADLRTIRQITATSHLTVVGHSYGSVVLGQAMHRGLRRREVADVVVVGSPGMDASSRRELGSPDVTLWASKATLTVPKRVTSPFNRIKVLLPPLIPDIGAVTVDPVAFAPAHGEDPSAHGFGAQRFSSSGTLTHGSYFAPNSVALNNMAKIAVGKGSTVTR